VQVSIHPLGRNSIKLINADGEFFDSNIHELRRRLSRTVNMREK